jgi:hypothetical protein
MPDIEVRILSPDDIRRHIASLSAILADCVAAGAGVTFLMPFTAGDARPFWLNVADGAEAGRLVVLGGFVDGALAGSVQLALVALPNQPHRAEVMKLIVSPGMRRRGMGAPVDAGARGRGAVAQAEPHHPRHRNKRCRGESL